MRAAVVAAAYAVQFRPESLLILPVVGLLVVAASSARPAASARLVGRRCCSWRSWRSTLAHLFAVRNDEWGTARRGSRSRYVPENLRVNGWFYLYDERFPAAFTAARRRRAAGPAAFGRERVAMAVYFLLFFGIGLVFYAGSYNYGADVRYSLMTYPPLAVLGGLGAARLVRGVSQLGAGRVPARRLAVAAALRSSSCWYAPVVRATTEEAWAARADVRFARSLAGAAPAELVRADAQSRACSSSGASTPARCRWSSSNPAYVALSRRPLYRRRLSALELLVQRAGSRCTRSSAGRR